MALHSALALVTPLSLAQPTQMLLQLLQTLWLAICSTRSSVWVGGCACNSRLNLVRLFVNPPHPTRARTPPCGYACAIPVVSAPVRACLCMPVRAPGTTCARCAPHGVCARCALPFRLVLVCRYLVPLPGASVRCPCVFCSRGALASFAPACPFCLWLPSGLRRPVPALPYAGRLALSVLAAAHPSLLFVVV